MIFFVSARIFNSAGDLLIATWASSNNKMAETMGDLSAGGIYHTLCSLRDLLELLLPRNSCRSLAVTLKTSLGSMQCDGTCANDSALGSNIPEWVGPFRLSLVGLCADFEQHMVGQMVRVGIEIFLNVIGGNDDPCGSIRRCDC